MASLLFGSVTGDRTLSLARWCDGAFAMSTWPARTPTRQLRRMADSSHSLAPSLYTCNGLRAMAIDAGGKQPKRHALLLRHSRPGQAGHDRPLDNISIFSKLHTFTNP